MTARNTYKRPMTGWYKRLPFYTRYLWREATCFAVLAYALVLLTGLWRYTQGAEAFNAWRAALASPLSLLLHAAILAGMVFHSWTWFEVMPKTIPFLRIGDKRVPDDVIVRGGVMAALAATVVVLGLAYWALK